MIVAAKIRFVERNFPRVLGVSSGPYFQSTEGLVNNTWYPILDPNISVSTSIATEHDQSRSGASFGDIRLADGGDAQWPYVLDRLLRSRVIGEPIDVKRGDPSKPWNQLEDVWARTETDQIDYDGRTTTIVQRSRWNSLTGTVNQRSFLSVPYAPTEGKIVPNVLGQMTSVGPVIIDPFELIYFIAQNVTASSAVVREGGNPITQDDINAFGSALQLTSNPLLPLTFDVLGSTFSAIQNIEDETVFEMTTTDSTNPDDFTVQLEGGTSSISGGVFTADIAVEDGTPVVDVNFDTKSDLVPGFQDAAKFSVGTDITATINGTGEPQRENAAVAFLKIPQSLPTSEKIRPVRANINLTTIGVSEELLVIDNELIFTNTGGANGFNERVTIKSIVSDVVDQTDASLQRTVNGPIVDRDSIERLAVSLVYTADDFQNSSVTINDWETAFSVGFAPVDVNSVLLYSDDELLVPGQSVLIRVTVQTMNGSSLIIGSSDSVNGDITDHDTLSGTGIKTAIITPTGRHLALRFQPARDNAKIEISRIGISQTSTVGGRLSILVGWLLDRVADVRTADDAGRPANISAASLDKLRQDIGDAEMGWYVEGGETVEEMLDLLIRDSANGVWSRDYDGVLRFALWRWAPDETTPLLIEPNRISATRRGTYVPQRVTKRVVGGKNQTPLTREQLAVANDDFSERERAEMQEEFRWWAVGSPGSGWS